MTDKEQLEIIIKEKGKCPRGTQCDTCCLQAECQIVLLHVLPTVQKRFEAKLLAAINKYVKLYGRTAELFEELL